jgi:CBS domain-containing protein
MLVQQILTSKPTGGVVTVHPSATLAQAVAVLAEHRIGAVVVSGDGIEVAGILSERDVVRELGHHGPSCMAFSVERVMTSKIVTCAASDAVTDVMQKMTDGRFRHLPVMDGGRVVGVVSVGDVVKDSIRRMGEQIGFLETYIKGHGA